MTAVSTHVDAPPSRVRTVLADGWLYPVWVVGTSHMRAVDADWPTTGSRLHHASGVWPLTLRDETQVIQHRGERGLRLVARGRPLGEVGIDIGLEPEDGGTVITLDETPISSVARRVHNPVFALLIRRRNIESLARLRALCEKRVSPR